jgi:phenylacetate-CoA ligase
MIWNPEYECMDRAALHALQLRRLQMTTSWAYERVPHWRAQLEERGVRPRDIKSLDDLRKLPFTDDAALAAVSPFGGFALPTEEVVRVHSSGSPSGDPVVLGYSRGDINTWTELTARVAAAAGVHRGDLVLMAFPYGMSTSGWGLHYGMERIGATIIPAGADQTERHVPLMRTFGATVLVSTPSYALFLAEQAEELGVDPASLKLRLGLFGGEPCPDAMKAEIEARLGLSARDTYGLSKVLGPGLAGECDCACGLHVNEDHLLLEVIDPDSGEPLDYGEQGELVITTLTKEALPVFRYRTRDLTALDPARCDCGRTLVRMRKVRQRTDDMLIIRGVNVYPSQIEAVLAGIEEVRPHYLIVVDRKRGLDDLEVRVEVDEALFSDVMGDMVRFQRKVAERIQSELDLRARVTLVEPGANAASSAGSSTAAGSAAAPGADTAPGSAGQSGRVRDLRQND